MDQRFLGQAAIFVLMIMLIGTAPAQQGGSTAAPTPPAPPGSAPNTTSLTNSIGAVMVLIPAGRFLMGSPTNEPGRGENETQHGVTISRAFLMGTTEVTQGQWRAVMGNNPSHFASCGDDCPVEQVTWYDAVSFCNRLSEMEGLSRCYNIHAERISWNVSCQGYRLPREAEWEYAARAGTTTLFNTGRCLSTDQANFHGEHPLPGCPVGVYRNSTIRVGSFSPNAWGLLDVHGNVFEWVWDWYGNYGQGSVTDPNGAGNGTHRVGRGGSWNNSAEWCRSANRSASKPGSSAKFVGFRLARSL